MCNTEGKAPGLRVGSLMHAGCKGGCSHTMLRRLLSGCFAAASEPGTPEATTGAQELASSVPCIHGPATHLHLQELGTATCMDGPGPGMEIQASQTQDATGACADAQEVRPLLPSQALLSMLGSTTRPASGLACKRLQTGDSLGAAYGRGQLAGRTEASDVVLLLAGPTERPGTPAAAHPIQGPRSAPWPEGQAAETWGLGTGPAAVPAAAFAKPLSSPTTGLGQQQQQPEQQQLWLLQAGMPPPVPRSCPPPRTEVSVQSMEAAQRQAPCFWQPGQQHGRPPAPAAPERSMQHTGMQAHSPATLAGGRPSSRPVTGVRLAACREEPVSAAPKPQARQKPAFRGATAPSLSVWPESSDELQQYPTRLCATMADVPIAFHDEEAAKAAEDLVQRYGDSCESTGSRGRSSHGALGGAWPSIAAGIGGPIFPGARAIKRATSLPAPNAHLLQMLAGPPAQKFAAYAILARPGNGPVAVQHKPRSSVNSNRPSMLSRPPSKS